MRHPARPAPARPALRDWSTTTGAGRSVSSGRTPEALRRRRPAARGLLHRHEPVHRLQGLRGRVQGVERRPGRRPRVHRESYDNTIAWAPTPGATSRSSSRRPQIEDRRRTGRRLRWLMSSDVCKHCTHAALPGGLPDRRAVPHRVRHGRRAAGHLQRLRLLRPACPFGVIDKREGDGRALKCTLCYDRLKDDGRRRARRPARRTRSSSASWTSCASAPPSASRSCTTARVERARALPAPTRTTASAAGAFFLLLDEPEVYGLPPDPVDTDARPRRDLGRGGAAALGARRPALAAALLGGRVTDLLLRPAGHQAAGLDAGDPRVLLLRRARRRSRGARPAGASSRQRRAGAARLGVALAGIGASPAAADLRPRRAVALPEHAARVQGHVADERRLVDPRRRAAPRPGSRRRTVHSAVRPRSRRSRRPSPRCSACRSRPTPAR